MEGRALPVQTAIDWRQGSEAAHGRKPCSPPTAPSAAVGECSVICGLQTTAEGAQATAPVQLGAALPGQTASARRTGTGHTQLTVGKGIEAQHSQGHAKLRAPGPAPGRESSQCHTSGQEGGRKEKPCTLNQPPMLQRRAVCPVAAWRLLRSGAARRELLSWRRRQLPCSLRRSPCPGAAGAGVADQTPPMPPDLGSALVVFSSSASASACSQSVKGHHARGEQRPP